MLQFIFTSKILLAFSGCFVVVVVVLMFLFCFCLFAVFVLFVLIHFPVLAIAILKVV